MDARLPPPRMALSREDLTAQTPSGDDVDAVPETMPLQGNVPTWVSVLQTRIGRSFRAIGRWIIRANQRDVLADLDDHLLRDVGISRIDAQRAWADPVWKPRLSHEGVRALTRAAERL